MRSSHSALCVAFLCGLVYVSVDAADPITEAVPATAESGCLECHAGIEWIREPDSLMMQQILDRGRRRGDPAGCVVCHGGDPREREDAERAHADPDGQRFYRAPGSPWVNGHTCGPCHRRHVDVQWTSLMMTEAGKIQGVCWAFGALTGYEHKWANYGVKNPDDPMRRLGTPAYRAYMQDMK